MISWLATRLLYGMMDEEVCWRIHCDTDSNIYTATDLSRHTRSVSTMLDIPLDKVEYHRFEGQGLAGLEQVKFYVRFRIAKAGLLFMVKFWKERPAHAYQTSDEGRGSRGSWSPPISRNGISED